MSAIRRILVRHERALVAFGIVSALVALVSVGLGLRVLAWVSGTTGMVVLVGLQLARGARADLPDGWP